MGYFDGKRAGSMVQKGRKVYILFQGGAIVGVWSNLKHLCSDMATAGAFPSYSALSKMSKEGGKIEFEKKGVHYRIVVEVVK
jgi:hypothetical protein